MKQIQLKRAGSTLAVLTLALVFVVGPVSAQHGADDTTTGSTSTVTTEPEHVGSTETTHNSGGSGSGTSGRSTTTTKTETENETEQQKAENSASHTELHKQGDDMVAKLRKEHAGDKVKTPAERQKVCEAHKKGIENKFASIVGNSNRAQTRITSILDKAVAFQQSGNVHATDFATLLATAQTAKATSAASIAALQAVAPSVDCNSTSVASDVATFKAAAQTTRTNLKAYKAAAKAVLKSLESAKPAETTEGSN